MFLNMSGVPADRYHAAFLRTWTGKAAEGHLQKNSDPEVIFVKAWIEVGEYDSKR